MMPTQETRVILLDEDYQAVRVLTGGSAASGWYLRHAQPAANVGEGRIRTLLSGPYDAPEGVMTAWEQITGKVASFQTGMMRAPEPLPPVPPSGRYSLGRHHPGQSVIHQPTVLLAEDHIDIHPSSRVDSFCKLNGAGSLTIREYVHIASFCDVNVGGGGCVIGARSTLSSHVVIATAQSVVGPGKSGSAAYPGFQKVPSAVYICEDVTVFAGAIICPGVTLEKGCVIAAGAVVTPFTTVPAGELWMGVPATKYRSL